MMDDIFQEELVEKKSPYIIFSAAENSISGVYSIFGSIIEQELYLYIGILT